MKKTKEEKATGISVEDATELGKLMEDVIHICEDAELNFINENEARKCAVASDQERASDIRKIAMETLSETHKREKSDDNESPKSKFRRRTRSGAMEFLQEKLKYDQEVQANK